MTTNQVPQEGNLSGVARPTAAGRMLASSEVFANKPVDPLVAIEARLLLATNQITEIVRIACEHGHLGIAACAHECMRSILDTHKVAQDSMIRGRSQ